MNDKDNRTDRDRSKENIPAVPPGMWIKCTKCGKLIYKKELEKNKFICMECGKYFRMPSENRILDIIDEGSFVEMFTDVLDKNPIDFPGYSEKKEIIKKETNLEEAVITGKASIGHIEVMLGVCDTRYLMGSMGYVVGEKITKLFENATKAQLPVIMINCSGGARMQEGIISLMQMAKTVDSVKQHSDAGLLYISVLTDPTTGGVAASFAMLGDVILAEPNSLIGFAGPRVIEQTTKQKLPVGFQTSEFLYEQGFLDMIVIRRELRERIYEILKAHQKPKVIERKRKTISVCTFGEYKDSWKKVQLSRKIDRPTTVDYITHVFEKFIEFHGDGESGEDQAIIGGIAFLDNIPVTVIGHQKGKTTEERIIRNFGMAHPEGYRKAIRLMKEAEKFRRPIITFIDTPGAACGVEAEKRGEASAIAKCIYEMFNLKVPILSILIGEGGSGGALGLAVANEVWAMENSTYSILSPEGFASILWKNEKRAKEAANLMKMTAKDLLDLGVIEKILPEGNGASEFKVITDFLQVQILDFIYNMSLKNEDEIVASRETRFRSF